MTLSDACIHPYPDGNSTLPRMALEALELGFGSCVALTTRPIQDLPLKVVRGILIREDTPKRISTALRRLPADSEVVMVEAGESGFNRAVLSLHGIHLLKGIARAPHASLDHVAARTAADHRIAVDIDLYPLIHERGMARQKVLQRYEDLLVLQRRFKFPLTISSGARSVLDQRSVRDMILLCSLFGMSAEEVHRALSTVEEITNRKDSVEVVR